MIIAFLLFYYLNLAGIVLCETGAEVGCAADVALVGVGETTEDVGVVHGELLLVFYVACLLVALVLICCLLCCLLLWL